MKLNLSDREITDIVTTQFYHCDRDYVSPDVDEEAWLQNRATGIGGSEIAAIRGKNSWSSPRQVYLRKVDEEAPRPKSEPARWGNLLEETIAEEWSERTGCKWWHYPVTLRLKDKPWCLANVDGFTMDDDNKVDGILEIKTTNAHNIKVWEDGPIPEYYIEQANWYTGICNLSKFTIACLVGGQRLFWYEFPFDKELFDKQVEDATKFWHENVVAKVPPIMCHNDGEQEQRIATGSLQDALPLIIEQDEVDDLCDKYKQYTVLESTVKKAKEQIKNQLKETMQGHREANTKRYRMTINPQSRRVINWDLLLEDFPNAYAACVSENQSLVFKVS